VQPIYLDNAATSWPKPAGVADAVSNWITHVGANPGRSGHRLSATAARINYDTRELLARLLGVADSRQIIFTLNATFALNTVISGFVRPGDHVVTTSMEHNSVMRPLRRLADTGRVQVTIVDGDADGRTDPERLAAALTDQTRLVIVNHASNVVGTLAPLREIRAAIGDVPLLVDGAQTAGVVPIDVAADGIDMLACAGHKGLLGPTGTGCLYISPKLTREVQPLMLGGTGSNSESDEQPEALPDHFESGTLNAAGIAGLGVGVKYILERGVAAIRAHELELTRRLLDGLAAIPGVTQYGPADPAGRVATVSINIAGLTPSEVGFALDREHNVMSRVGLHCAPMAHRTIGTFPDGTVRLGACALTTEADIDAGLAAVRAIAQGARHARS